MNSASTEVLGSIESEASPAPCELCGQTIEDVEELIYLRASDLVAQWERADPRDCWRHTGERPPPAIPPAPTSAPQYRTAQSTIDAFFFVVRLGDVDHLKRWLAQHPLDAQHLHR